jgi:hypothetical protein
MKILRKAV